MKNPERRSARISLVLLEAGVPLALLPQPSTPGILTNLKEIEKYEDY